mgnify:CR=1 FL=1
MKAANESHNTLFISKVFHKAFVKLDEIDPIYFDHPYYLGPDKGAARAYHLLAEALRSTDRIAVGRYAARGRQHLVLVRPKENGLLLEQLHYADEVRAFSEAELPWDELAFWSTEPTK